MSILTISKEEMAQRKITSDKKNDTDDLTFENRNKRSSHGEAAKKVRDRVDIMNIQKLLTDDNTSYFEALFKEC